MTSISNWYNNQYSTWNRTRRLSATPYLARTNTNTSRTATAMSRNNAAQEAVVANMGDLSNLTNNKKQDTLFGPNIGVVTSGPAWTETNKKKPTGDQLTPEVVKGWIEKSKEASQPTTTLQALVNLKRPTLRLSPLSPAANDDPSQTDSHDHHGLEFEYDCDAPKCGIYVHALLSSDHADSSDKTGLSRVLIFETVVDGGFGKILKLEEGATLELGRLERQPAAHPEDPSVSGTDVDGRADTPGLPGVSDEAPRKNRRFTHFHFRKRDQDREVAGPALAVVDAEIGTAAVEGDKDKDSKTQVEDGVKVIIRLVALGGDGNPLSSPNEQATYLHVVRMGVAPVEGEDDLRQWVVKVVKREATIGPHTFHLHEIYGLSSQSSSASKSVASVPTSPTTTEVESHSYPPTSPTLPKSVVREEEPSSECLLCLSSPREVVLLPCRHLVACKDCALNMVEFGAGGNIIQPEEPVAPTAATAAEGAEGGSAEPTAAAAVAAPATPIVANPTRRKRKAKGWFCPVCRQPYTSLLRITTTPPTKGKDIDKRASTSTDGIELTTFTAAPTAASPTTPSTPSRGALASLRPAFLRGMSRGSTTALGDTLPPDLERGEALPA